MTISILMFCPQFRPLVGGAERQAEKLAKTLIAKGIRVKIITPRYSVDVSEHEYEEGLEIYRFSLFDLNRIFPGLRGIGWINLRLIRLQIMRAVSAHLKDVDLVHTHIASPLSAFTMQAAARAKTPVICKVAMAGEESDFSATAAIGLGGRSICSSMAKHMTRWIAITRPVAEALQQWQIPKERIVFIPNGVELPVDAVEYKNRPAKRYLYLGRLSKNTARDVPTLIRAFDRLASKHPEVELALVGNGDQFQETVELVGQCTHKDRIKMPGFQEPEPWLKWADCFVLPSRREGLSNALLEAMAHGLPCIANDIPPNREVLQDAKAGILVPVEDEELLFEKMLKMAESKEDVSLFSKAALHRVRGTYSIKAVAEQYIHLYGELVANHIDISDENGEQV